MIELKINPVAKPRMTRRDKWDKRKATDSYWAFKDHLNLLCNLQGFELGDKYKVRFEIKMPDSWSEKKRLEFDGKPHQQRSDLDNFLKSLNDCLRDEDSTIYSIEASKYWSREGKIIFY